MAYKKHKQYRLFGFDYSSLGAYFITINTKDRTHYFGEIENEQMNLSQLGVYIEENFKIIEQRLTHLQVDEYQIMPNHIHLIISIIEKPNEVQIVKGLSPLAKKSVSSFCNHLKGNIKNWCNKNELEFDWQARYHDRINRSHEEYQRIATYIRNNVKNWDKEKKEVNMAQKKQKYYVVWQGKNPGIYLDWKEAELQIKGVADAKFKSFESENEAKKAFSEKPEIHIYKKKQDKLSLSKSGQIAQPIANSIAVDAACSGNPGVLEYQVVETSTKKVIYASPKFPEGTVNLGEFLALVHGLAFLKKHGSEIPIYSDSRTAIAWVRNKKIKTNLERSSKNSELFELVDRALTWLNTNTYPTKVLKWETEYWGENPADYGRK